jgi:hypothetical protein
MFGIITIATEVADSGDPQVFVSADTQKSLFCITNDKVLHIWDYK